MRRGGSGHEGGRSGGLFDRRRARSGSLYQHMSSESGDSGIPPRPKGAELRTHVRYPLYLDAMVIVPGVGSIHCKARDYCEGGMFLAWEGGTMPAVALARGTPITVQFRTASEGREYGIAATVARALSGGMGVAFANPDPIALAVLEAIARQGTGQRAGASGHVTGPERDRLRAETRTLVNGYVGPISDVLFKRLDERFFLAARDAGNNVEQRAFFDTVAILKMKKEELVAVVRAGLLDRLDHLGQRGDDASTSGGGSGLSLVGKDEFEELLIIAEIVSRAEQRYKEQLWRVEGRLSQIADHVVDRGNNPVGPSAVCRLIAKALEPLQLPAAHLKMAYEIVDETVVPQLAALYGELDRHLEQAGLQVKAEVAAPPPARAQRRPQRPVDEQAVPVAAPVESQPGPLEVPGQAVHAGAGAFPPAAGSGAVPVGPYPSVHGGIEGANWPGGAYPQPSAQAADRPSAPVTGAPGATAQQPVHAPADYPGGPYAPGPPAAGAWPAGPPSGPVYTPPSPPGSGPAMASAGAAGPLPSGPPVAFQAVRTLLGLQRQLAAANAVALPAGETPAMGPSSAFVSAGSGGAGAYSPQDVLQAMDSLENEDRGPWGEETQGQDFHRRLLSVLASRSPEGGKALGSRESDALAMVGGMLNSMRADPALPAHMVPQLRRLRTPLHKLALMDERFLSDPAHPARQVVNRLAQLDLDAAPGPEGDALREQVDGYIERVAGDFQRNPQVFDEVLGELDKVVEERGGEYRRKLREVVQECDAQQAVLRAKRKADGSERAPQKEPSKEWAVWLNRAKRLRVGDGIMLKRGAQPPQRAALAWVGDDYGSFVFANGRGERAANMTLQELAMQLRRGSVRVLDRTDLPAMDRALYSALYRMHDDIGRQALHDPLTGLVNRKKFEAMIERRLVEAGQDGDAHAVAVLRFDGIAELAGRAGEAAANSLLRKLAEHIGGRLGEGATLARLDDSMFGLLLDRVSPEGARPVAEDLLALVEKVRVRYKDERFSISGNIGLAPLDAATDGAASVLAAATAAAELAHAGGANTIAIAQGAAVAIEAIAAGDSVDWRSWLEQTLADDTLVLRAERVRPVAAHNGTDAYSEVLLGAEVDGRVVLMPRSFGRAPEMAEQMRALDRLVLRESLRWIERNRDIVERIGGCAVNLSAHSLTDPSLMDYVLVQLTETMVPPGRICFEIAEAAAVGTLDETERFIRTLKEFGCRFVLEGFGSSDTAQGHLNSLPVDYLKIDGMFLRDLETSQADVAVVRSIAEIGRLMGKKTIAAAVPAEGVLARLLELGVDYAQGPAVAPVCLLADVA